MGREASGHPQYLAVSLVGGRPTSSGRRPEDLISWISAELGRLLPDVRGARILDSRVTKERRATFRARPGSGRLRPPARTAFAGLAVAGAWTSTGWPATMEGAVRSGQAAARTIWADLGHLNGGNLDQSKIRTPEEVA